MEQQMVERLTGRRLLAAVAILAVIFASSAPASASVSWASRVCMSHGYDGPSAADASTTVSASDQEYRPFQVPSSDAGFVYDASVYLVATNTAGDAMAGVRAAGSAGEQAAGIVKNTDRIPSLSGTASYRIPDELNATVLGEVKNVGYQAYTQQLRDFAAYAQQEGLTFNLYVRGGVNPTVLSGPLQTAVDEGVINLIWSLP
ncbi:MAG: hypothetical protein GY788_12275 [bacterium]|nr:hypothetical protein [bacterium]